MFKNALLDEKNKVGYAISINELIEWNKGRVFITCSSPSGFGGRVILNASDLSNFECTLSPHPVQLRKYRIEELYE